MGFHGSPERVLLQGLPGDGFMYVVEIALAGYSSRSGVDNELGELFLPWSVILRYAACMKVDKLSVSFDPDLGDAVRAAARQRGGGLSRWLADAAAAKLRTEALADFLDAWEAEHGPLTAAELAKAADELAVPKPATTEPAA